jgi:hypothetical protein
MNKWGSIVLSNRHPTDVCIFQAMTKTIRRGHSGCIRTTHSLARISSKVVFVLSQWSISEIPSRPQSPDRPRGPTHLPAQFVPRTLSRGQRGRGVKLTTHLHLVPKSRMVELFLHFPNTFTHFIDTETKNRPRSPGFDSRRCQIFWVVVGLEGGPLSPCEDKWGATWKKSIGSGLENWD